MLENNDEDNRDGNKKTKQERIRAKNWVRRRDAEGFCAKLLIELRNEEPKLYRNFVRMTAEQRGHEHAIEHFCVGSTCADAALLGNRRKFSVASV